MRSAGRLALVLALVPCMVCLTAIAPEHVHEADAHHSHSLTHRHFEAHDHGDTEIEPGEGRIIWLDSDFGLHHAVYHLDVDDIVVLATVGIVPSLTSWMLASILDTAPPHGPPRPDTALRAPPLLSA